MVGGNQPGEHRDAARFDVEVVIAAAKALAAAFHHAKPAPFAAIDRRQLVEVDDAMRNAVNRAVGALGGEIVEHDDRGVMLSEIMLQRQNLPPVAQRALRQQTDFRETVDDDPLRLYPLDAVENALHGLAELEIGRIQQALVLIGIEHTLRRHQLENLDLRPDRPAMGPRAVTQFVFGLGEADIDSGFARFGAGEQELQRDRRLAGTGAALQQVQPVAG